MPTLASAIMPPNHKLQSSDELHRPDRHGQMPHIISTTYPDRPIEELQLDDILGINWTGVETAVRDVIMRIEREGDLTPATIRSINCLVALALKKLELEDSELQRVLAAHPGIGFWGWAFAWAPGEAGKRLRRTIGIRSTAKRQRNDLASVREMLFSRRTDLSNAIDGRVDSILMMEDAEYRALAERLGQFESIRTTAKSMIGELEELAEIELNLAANSYWDSSWAQKRKRQIEKKLPAFTEFCAEHCGAADEDRGEIEVRLGRLVSDLDAKAAPLEKPMAARRDAWKQRLYQHS